MNLQYLLGGILILVLLIPFEISAQSGITQEEKIYLQQIRKDFIAHRKDAENIRKTSRTIVGRIDSLLAGDITFTAEQSLITKIMITQPYKLTILAYRDILNGDYISDPHLQLQVSRHLARFEGNARTKSMIWDKQWDDVARPLLYEYGILNRRDNQSELLDDPVVRSFLFDRRMFAYDVEYITPWMLTSADSIIATIDRMIEK